MWIVATIHSCEMTSWTLSVCNPFAKYKRHSECNKPGSHGDFGLRKDQMVNIHK